MPKAIATRAYPDGTFPECGMMHRTVIGPYKRESFIIKRAKEYANGVKCRIEFYPNDNIQGEPFKVIVV